MMGMMKGMMMDFGACEKDPEFMNKQCTGVCSSCQSKFNIGLKQKCK